MLAVSTEASGRIQPIWAGPTDDVVIPQKGDVADPDDVRPFYMREPDVDINWSAFRSEGAWSE